MQAYWINRTVRQMLEYLVENNIIRTVRYNPTGMEFFYAGRIVSLTWSEAKWFCLAHLYHMENWIE